MPTTGPVVQLGDETELYRRYQRELVHAVARSVNASRELIEDACQTAWLILLRRQPDRERVFGWLRTVAIHEAYRLSGSVATLAADTRVEAERSCPMR